MRRWTVVALAGLAWSGAAWGGTYDARPILTLGSNPIESRWLGPVSGSAMDASMWSSGYAPRFPYSPFLRLVVRDIGGPYVISALNDTIRARSLRVFPSGVTIVIEPYDLVLDEYLDLQHGTLHMRSTSDHGGPTLIAKSIRIGGRLVIEGRRDIGGPPYLEPIDEFVVTGELTLRAVLSGWDWNDVELQGALDNRGRLTLTGTGPDQTLYFRATDGIVNSGEIVLEPGLAQGQRIIDGLTLNSGEITVTTDDAIIYVLDDTLTNTGDIRVAPGGLLEMEIGTLRQQGGLIESQGELVMEVGVLEWSGGSFGQGAHLLNTHVEMIGEGATGRIQLRGACTLEGDIGPNVIIDFGTLTHDGETTYATVLWPGGVNRGVIEARDVGFNRLTAASPIVNEGVVYANGGWVLSQIVGPGEVRLARNGLIGVVGNHHVFDGPVNLDPEARAQVTASSTTLRSVLTVRPEDESFSPGLWYQVRFSGTLVLDGATLSIQPGPDFEPEWGDIYNLVDVGAVVGGFAAVEAAALPDENWLWEIERYNNDYRGRISHRADVDRDFDVDFGDVNAVVAAWHTNSEGHEDVNGDGFVDFADLAIVVAHFGQSAFGG